MAKIYFNDALRLAVQALRSPALSSSPSPRIIRDVYGRVRYAVDCERAAYPSEALAVLEKAQVALGPYATSQEILFHDSFSDPRAVFGSPDWHRTIVSLGVDDDGQPLEEVVASVMDRQITGQDWLRPSAAGNAHPHRLVFFGLKGGVGRSTALCMVAWGLARKGKRVLLIDFDLESPGLSGLILPSSRVAEFGIVDWLVEDAVGQGDDVLNRMVSESSLGETTTGAVRVAAAMGQSEQDYLAKLARAYADVPGSNGPQRMGERMLRLVERLEGREKPDVVLIDSRAGLHDLAAVSITGLADTALLFATDGAQTWSGYAQLFAHWRKRPDVATRVRERLALVRALTPKTGNREASIRQFKQRAYELFAELYDEIPADVASVDPAEYFHPGESDESAPHAPILIDWDERFQEFDPGLRFEDGGASDAQIEAAFGGLIRWAAQQAFEEVS